MENMELPLFERADFWEEAWQEEYRNSLYGRRRPERDGSAYWNRRAGHFARQTGSEEGKQRVAGILHWLGHHGGLEKDLEVLDIGCGTGNYALPLARRARRVVALDPAAEMLAILKEKAAAEGINNVEPIQMAWEDVDLEKQGWREAFDLVLALMSPGIKDAATLKKMMAASRGACFLAGHVRQEISGRRELWQELIGGEMPPIPADVLYIFHLLYAWGYNPSLELEHKVSTRELEPDQAIEEMEIFFYPHLELTPAVRRTIINHVQANTVNGRYPSRREMTVAYLSWNVNLH
ncbi:class I SAM-dependent methyltransferase [Neomoorella thermoacetica]|uniref:class I SAM-dependent methyltransferase n=1 Tax=Neomoorella thermoacetica TaxID=1525 RepID=UPI0008FB479B|nr:class I SAM-dependent methyltransferase [Moorella thermoacetica]APC08842.1 tRNA/tmRNA (uracil-C(5))-methyltransferase [Moorella thermoacetica]